MERVSGRSVRALVDKIATLAGADYHSIRQLLGFLKTGDVAGMLKASQCSTPLWSIRRLHPP